MASAHSIVDTRRHSVRASLVSSIGGSNSVTGVSPRLGVGFRPRIAISIQKYKSTRPPTMWVVAQCIYAFPLLGQASSESLRAERLAIERGCPSKPNFRTIVAVAFDVCFRPDHRCHIAGISLRLERFALSRTR